MVTLSCLAKKNQNLNSRKKKFSLILKMEICGLKTKEIFIFSNKLSFFSSGSKGLIILPTAMGGSWQISGFPMR